jgi:hypothetical protein
VPGIKIELIPDKEMIKSYPGHIKQMNKVLRLLSIGCITEVLRFRVASYLETQLYS